MSWTKEFNIREEKRPGSATKIVFECKLRPIPSDTPINKIGPNDKVRIGKSHVIRMIN